MGKGSKRPAVSVRTTSHGCYYHMRQCHKWGSSFAWASRLAVGSCRMTFSCRECNKSSMCGFSKRLRSPAHDTTCGHGSEGNAKHQPRNSDFGEWFSQLPAGGSWAGSGAWGSAETSSDRKDCCQSMLRIAPVATELQIKAPGGSSFDDPCIQPSIVL